MARKNNQLPVRTLIWLTGGLIALTFSWFGKDASQVLAIISTVAGGI